MRSNSCVNAPVIYANTHLQELSQHLFAVGYAAKQIHLHFYPDKKNQANAVFVAGCFHDIGKIDFAFQNWVVKSKNKNYLVEDGQHIDDVKFSFENHPRHNEISALIFQWISESAPHIKHLKQSIKHVIYWHHAKPFRVKSKDAFNTYGKVHSKLNSGSGLKQSFDDLVLRSLEVLDGVVSIDKTYHEDVQSYLEKAYNHEVDDEVVINYEKTPLPDYKDYIELEDIEGYQGKTKSNATNNVMRSCLIVADRLISSLTAEELSSHINSRTLDDFVASFIEGFINVGSNLSNHIKSGLSYFPESDRSVQQSLKAKELSHDTSRVKVLSGPAGCGKTKISLEWASLSDARQIIWVCPRVQVCQGIFNELKDAPYLKGLSIEILTGEYKFTNDYNNPTPDGSHFTSDIVITTIDQLLEGVISHTKADHLLSYLGAHIVFDEYHEYVTMPAFNLLFAELIASRSELGAGANALLVSATPHYYYLEKILGMDVDFDVIEMPSFNKSQYKINCSEYDESGDIAVNPLFQKHEKVTFVISNAATTAQKSFIHNLNDENAILMHSKFKNSDKKELFNRVFESFKLNGNGAFNILRSGPIVQASLNISCENMVSDITSAENTLQRLGRLDRFGLSNEVNHYTIAMPFTFLTSGSSGKVAGFLSSMNALDSTKVWHKFLMRKTDSGKQLVTIADLYSYYREFYTACPESLQVLAKDMIAAMKKSVSIITHKVSDPRVVPRKPKDSGPNAKIAKTSLRGDSRFVQMAVCDLSDRCHPKFLDEYAYELNEDPEGVIDNITASCDLIQGYGDSNKNLLGFMAKKHHIIKSSPKPYKDFILLNLARDPLSPIFMSYTPSDIEIVGGARTQHEAAVFYGICYKQAIGAISLKHLPV